MAEVLLHRTLADTVARYYEEVLKGFQSPTDVIEKPQTWIEKTDSLGLMWRRQSFIEACQIMTDLHGSTVPSETETLLALPGVGHYLAGAVRVFGFGLAEVLVETNTIRIASRISGERLDQAKHRSSAVRTGVGRIFESTELFSADRNYSLIDLGQLVCRPKQPTCLECPVQPWCSYASEQRIV